MTETPITVVRNATHGDFRANAGLSQGIKNAMRCSNHWDDLSPVSKEALEMIALKISRILSGQEGYEDHWLDIEGYARLGRHRGEAK